MTPRKKQIALILVVFTCVVCVDQVSKAIIRSVYPGPETVRMVGPHPVFFRFTHQHNPGIVGGIFRDKPVMAYAAPLCATLVLIYLFRHLLAASNVQSIGYGLICGGAVGNLADRIRLGHVTDFLQFHFYFIPFDFPWKYYPAFNFADASICTGVFLLILSWYWVGQNDAVHAA